MPNRYSDQGRWTEQDRRDRLRDEDDVNWNDGARARGEGRSWAGAERAFGRTEGYGQYARQDDSRAYRDRDDWGDAYGARSDQPSRIYGVRETWGRDQGRSERQPRSGEFGRDYGVSRAYGQGYDRPTYARSQGYETHGYAPGSQIWEGSDRASNRSEYEPDYLHWREQQMSKFDRDYDDWRSERRQKFSSDFDTWRTNRADNPIVGDVADGGVGSQKDLKKD